MSFIYGQNPLMSEYIPYSSFWVWVTSLRIVFSISIHLHAKFKMSLLFTTEQYSNVYIFHTFFIHSSFEGHLGCFQFLAITNSATINIVEQMLFQYDWASLGYIPKSGIAGSWGSLILNFLRNRHTDFQSGCTSLHSHQQWMSVPLTPHPLQQRLSLVFLILAILTGIRWYLKVVLICISLIAKEVQHDLKCLLAI